MLPLTNAYLGEHMTTGYKIAQGWDAAYAQNEGSQLWNEEAMPILDDVLARARARGLRTCLDIGCGDGRNMLALQAGGLDVAGLDISPTALARADGLLRKRGNPATLLVGDIADLPVASGTLDVVTALDVAGQVPDPRGMLAEAHRVLRPSGMLVVNLFSPEDDTFGEGEQVGRHAFMYRETLFCYYEREELDGLFDGGWNWETDLVTWNDPPHGTFRPYEHTHVNHVIYATPI
jgi:SAM-dependent methyltransferase